MEICFIRHAIAVEAQGSLDQMRVLSADGQIKMQRGLRGLFPLFPEIDFLGSSPLIRAKQTAEMIKNYYRLPFAHELIELAPGSPLVSFSAWLSTHKQHYSKIALVGHEPDLSLLVSYLLTGQAGSRLFVLKKGGACAIRFPHDLSQIGAGRASLSWLIEPRVLRRLRAT